MQRVPLCSISRLSSPVRQAKRLQERRKYYYKDTNIDDVVDNLDSQEQIKKQIALIEEEIENAGKVCDRRQINSEKEFSDKIEEERKELDHQIMKALETSGFSDSDTLYFTGDICDRGKKNKEVVDFLLSLGDMSGKPKVLQPWDESE